MYKRKILGILKYGTRGYAPTQKFQEGGFVAVSKAYDWREDPYEIMLLQQKAAEKNAMIRSAGKKGPGSGSSASNKISTFDRLKGGLPVTNAYINSKTAESQEEFYNKVRTSEEGWASSVEGQIAFKKVVNEGAALEEQAKNEETNFTDALNKIENEDKLTYAISTKDGVMAQDASGKVQRIQMSTYLDNVDKFKILNINEFADWKKNADTELQSHLTDEFLKNSAVGHNTMRKTYIDGKEDQIKYTFANGQLVKKANTGDAPGEDLYDISLFKKGLDNMMLGVDFYKGTDVQEASKNQSAMEVVNSIYRDIMAGSANQSQLGASLSAEILGDRIHLDAIHKKGTSQERINYLEEQKKLLLVSKIVDKNKPASGSDSSSDSAGGSTTHKTSGSNLYADLNAVFDQRTATQYTIGVNGPGNKKRTVNDVNMPMIKDGLTPANLQLVTDPKASVDDKERANKFNKNVAIDAYVDKSEMFLPSGQNLRSVLGNSAEVVKQFISEDAVIAPNDIMPIVYMPVDAKGNIRSKDLLDLVPLKMNARRKFLVSVKGKLPNDFAISTSAENLLPGNIDAKAKADYAEYSRWLQKGAEVEKYKKIAGENPNNEDAVNNFVMAKEAAQVIKQSSSEFSRISGDGIQLQPMLGTWIVFDNDRHSIKESIDKKVGNGFGKGMVLKATDKERAFLQDVNGIDNFNWSSDNTYKMMIFTKVKSLDRAAAESGEKLPGVAQLSSLQNRIDDFMSTRSSLTSPGNYDNIQLFLNQ